MSLRLIASLLLVILAGYGAVAAWPLLSGPTLKIVSPEEYATLPDGRFVLEGRALYTETLWLNGAPLLIDQKGHFRAPLTLPSGGAILSLTATDRFGREITERRFVYSN
jgi:hypothetical protein